MAKINILSKNAFGFFDPRRFLSNDRSVERASEIVQEVFEKFLKDVGEINNSSALLNTQLQIKTETTRSGLINHKRIEIEVVGRVYQLLDDGYEKELFASNYTVTAPDSPRQGKELKAFPILVRRGVLTEPNSLRFHSRPDAGEKISKYASNGEPFREVGDGIVFRKYVNLQVEARNFTQEIAKEAQKRVDAEGLNVTIGAVDG